MLRFLWRGIIVLALVALGVSNEDPFTTLVAYETKQKEMAGVNESQYHLLPFRLQAGEQQHFLQTPNTNEIVYAEAVVHWITQNSSLKFPSFDLSQKIRIIIEEETFSTAPTKAILTKEFLTQTGFTIQLEAGRRYRWRIESSGKEQKMVEIALASLPYSLTTSQDNQSSDHYSEVNFLKQMSITLERVKTSRAHRQKTETEQNVSSMWAWMSGVQILSLLGVVLIQLALFQKFMLPTSIV